MAINYFYVENAYAGENVLTLNSDEGMTNIEYATDPLGVWTTVTFDTPQKTITIPQSSKVYLRGTNQTLSSKNNNSPIISCSQSFNVGGDLTTLLVPEGNVLDLTGRGYVFSHLFHNSKVVDASKLILPATTLAPYCYYGMFEGCTSLTQAPELPATELANSCYYSMFFGCISLTQAPELPATTLAPACYYSMFFGCTLLTTAPELPATTLAPNCYYSMFTYCTSLTTAPELPATQLADGCYTNMFAGCTKLNKVTALFTDNSARDCLYGWLNITMSTGTFLYNPEASAEVLSSSEIPAGWKIVPYYLSLNVRIKSCTKLESEWLTNAEVLLKGEIGFASDTKVQKVGDGKHLWKDLPIFTKNEESKQQEQDTAITNIQTRLSDLSSPSISLSGHTSVYKATDASDVTIPATGTITCTTQKLILNTSGKVSTVGANLTADKATYVYTKLPSTEVNKGNLELVPNTNNSYKIPDNITGTFTPNTASAVGKIHFSIETNGQTLGADAYVYAVHHKYFGIITKTVNINTINEAIIKGGTEIGITTSRRYVVEKVNKTAQKAFFAYPAYMGMLTSISDGGFVLYDKDHTSGFEVSSTIQVNGINYYVFIEKDASSVDNYTYIFN